jgi:hypothetical protein
MYSYLPMGIKMPPSLNLESWSSVNASIYCDVWWYTPLIRRVLVWMIGFIITWVTHSHQITLAYSSTALSLIYTLYSPPLHTHYDFSVSTSRFPATALNAGIITVSLIHTLQILHTKKVFHSHDQLFSNYEPSIHGCLQSKTLPLPTENWLVNELQSLL